MLRGKWILENILGTPPPAPPANVPALDENKAGEEAKSQRERLEVHRRSPACASCHRVMDPLGFALENFDGIGEWRVKEVGGRIDPTGQLADGSAVDGPVALRRALTRKPEMFVRTVTEKLMTYGLGRGMEYADMPTIRAIARDAARQEYRFSSIVLGIVKSAPFQMKRAPRPEGTLAVRTAWSLEPVARSPIMFITRKHLDRRTFLQGLGVGLALPLLDAMVPARTLLAQTAAAGRSRLGFVYVPHGAVMDKWTPAATGAGFEFTPILKPLEAFRDRMNVVTGLGHQAADTTAVHSLSPTTWLSGVRPEGHAGRGRLRRHHRRPDRRAGDRPGLVAALDGAGHRGPLGPHRVVRSRLRLHLHEHAVVAHANHAAAHGDQPAQGVRADVRPGRERLGSRGAHPRGPQHPGRDRQGSRRPAGAAGTRRPPDDDAVPRQRPRDRAPHPARGEGAGRRGAAAARRARPACRSSSRSTCG